jgi:uncharacterized membrane protein YqhA
MQQKRQLTLRTWEKTAFAITLLFMGFLFVYHYYEVIGHIASGIQNNDSSEIVGNVIELGFVILAASFFVL